MKEYNRTTKRWEEKDESKIGSLKKRKLCKGRKEHDFQLCLPDYLDKHQTLTPEAIQEYYNSEERIANFLKNESELLSSLGIIKSRYHGISRLIKYFKCSVCGKKEYEHNE